MNNFTFKIEYTLGPDLDSPSRAGRRHVRRYNALSESIALEMFKETVSSGSLIGEKPEIVSVTVCAPTDPKDPLNPAKAAPEMNISRK